MCGGDAAFCQITLTLVIVINSLILDVQQLDMNV